MSNLHRYTVGTGPTIYFLHGHALNYQSMESFYEPTFTENAPWRRVYLDIPGMGASKLAPESQQSTDVLQQLISFIEADAADHPFFLSGHSFGGYLCLGLASHFKERVQGLFLTCPVVKARHVERQVEVHQNVHTEAFLAKKNHAFFTDYTAMNVQINARSWAGYQEAILPGLQKTMAPFWQQLSDEDYALPDEPRFAQSLQKQRGTVLLGAFDQIVGYRDQLTLLAEIPDLHAQVLAQSGHNLPLDQPEAFRTAFSAFLTEAKIKTS